MNKEEINELIMLLPINIRESKEFTTKTKLVLAQLILMNGMDKAKNDGYFFATNKKLVDELGIAEKTLIKILRILEKLGYIKRKQGKRGEASEYIVYEELIFNNTKNYSNNMEKYSNNTVNENYSNKIDKITVINYSKKIDELTLIINDLVKVNQQLITKVENLENTVKKLSNYSTDTESDTELELDINNNIKIKENNILEKKEENKEYFNKEFFKLLEEKDKEIENKKRKKSELTWKGDKVDEPLSPYEEYLFKKAESSSIF